MQEAVTENAVTTQEVPQEAISADQGTQTNQQAKTPARELASPQLAILAKREKALQKQREELQKSKLDIDSKYEEINKFKSLKEQAKTNPLKFLEEAGLTYEELTNFILNGNKPTAEMETSSIKTEMQKLREEILKKEQEREASLKAQEEQRVQEAISTFKDNISSFLTAKPDDFELCNNYPNSVDLIYDVIEAHFAQTEKVMSMEEAAKLVEDHFESEAMKVTSFKKIQSKLAPKPAATEEDGFQRAKSSASPTLNNTMSQTVSGLSSSTEQDRIKRALAALGN